MKRSAALLALALAGCATPGAYDVQNTQTFQAPYDQVWSAVIEYFAANNIGIATVEKDSGIIVARRTFATPADFWGVADCGGEFNTTTTQASSADFNVFARPADGGVRVTVNARFNALGLSLYGNPQPVQCVSKGVLESAVLAGIVNRL